MTPLWTLTQPSITEMVGHTLPQMATEIKGPSVACVTPKQGQAQEDPASSLSWQPHVVGPVTMPL